MKGRIFFTLFGLPFFAVGVWMLWSISTTLLESSQMDDWLPINAQLTRGGYQSHSGDDSTTYEAFATYRYEINGVQYQGNRVSLNDGADNIGDYQTEIGSNLQRAQTSGSGILVYVNPNNPAESIIDRGVRWGLLGFKLIFLLLFGGVGLGLIVAAWMARVEKDKAVPENSAAPWLLNKDWQTASIRSTSKAAMYGAWIFATIWCLISAPLPFVLYAEIVEKQNYPAIIGLLFPIVGVGLVVWALRRTLEWTRFGPAPITMDPFPGSIGGHVGGTIDLKLAFDPSQKFAVGLTCIHSYESGSGKDRRQNEKAIWQDNSIAHAELGAHGSRLTFRFDVPAGLQESDTQNDRSYYIWRLNLSAELPGADLDRDYELPVYATATQSRFLSNIAVQKSHDMQRTVDDKAVRERVNFQSSNSGKRLFFPAGRHIGSAIGGFFVGGIFAASGWFLIVKEGHTVFGSVFGGVGALVALGCLYMMLNSLEVILSGQEIASVRRLLGITIGRKRMQRSALVEFRKDSSFKTQTGNKHVIYYSIQALDRHGNKLVIGEGFKGENEANAAIRLLRNEFGLLDAANDAHTADDQDHGSNALA